MPVYSTDDGIGITSTGMGISEAATTVTSILAAPELDCSDTYFLSVGIAGTTPEVGTLGSVSSPIRSWIGTANSDGPSATIRNLPATSNCFRIAPEITCIG
ncbi:hypothetical protein [Haladaptatus sp. DFWS20]|uniref:hypothetical protein n=1 Tax=Haladaptatus sp. DFWS20 TaxID=3403467 RepID=UPI003EB99E60